MKKNRHIEKDKAADSKYFSIHPSTKQIFDTQSFKAALYGADFWQENSPGGRTTTEEELEHITPKNSYQNLQNKIGDKGQTVEGDRNYGIFHLLQQGHKQSQAKLSFPSATPYLHAFDGLRALALILVLLYHWLPNFFKGGYLGVVIFFTLSGYLVTDSFFREYKDKGEISIGKFYARRLKRLYPSLLLMLALVSTWVLFFQRNALFNFQAWWLSSLLGFNNWWQIATQASYFEQFAQINLFTHLWTLGVEIQFYFLWPLLLYGILRLGKYAKRVLLFLTLLATSILVLWMSFLFLTGVGINRIYYGTDTRAFSFLLGASLACLISSKKMLKIRNYFAPAVFDFLSLFFILLLLYMAFVLRGTSQFVYTGGMLLFNLLILLLMVTVNHEKSFIGRLFSSRLAHFISQRSYAMYLWQVPIITLVFYTLQFVSLHSYLKLFIQIALFLFLSEVTYRYAEQGSFLFRKMKPRDVDQKQWNVRRPKQGFLYPLPYRLLSVILLCALSASSVYALRVAPRELPEDIKELQRQLQENRENNLNTEAREEALEREKQIQDERKKQAELNQKKKVQDLGQAVFSNKKYRDRLATFLPVPFSEEKASLDFPYALEQVPTLKLDEFEAHLAPNLSLVVLGDSVLLGAQNEVLSLFPGAYVDGEVGRQFPKGEEMIDALQQENKLPQIIVMALGSNGVISDAMVDQFVQKYAKHKIFLVNTVVPNSSEDLANTAIHKAVTKYQHVYLIDWYSLAKEKSEWFASDFVHPEVRARAIYAQLLAKTLLSTLLTEAKKELEEELKKIGDEGQSSGITEKP